MVALQRLDSIDTGYRILTFKRRLQITIYTDPENEELAMLLLTVRQVE